MNAALALGLLRGLSTPIVTTADASALLRLPIPAASKTLERLAYAGLLLRIRKGVWSLNPRPDPLLVVEYMTAPHPSYVSLLSALYLHGMIRQIPAVIYAASLSRTQRIKTSVATFSIHRIAPEFFGGFDLLPSGVKLATKEKALLDVLYLSSTRSRLFASLPEIEIPRSFSKRVAREWIGRIPTRRLRSMVDERFNAVI